MTWSRWLRRHLSVRPGRTAISILAVVVGVAVYVGVGLGTRAVIRAIRTTGIGAADPDAVEFLQAIEAGLAPLAGAALMVSGFIIYLTTSRTVGDRTSTFGTLRAIGASRTAVVGAVLAEALVIGIVGTAGGVALGHVIGPVVADTMAAMFDITVGAAGGVALTDSQLLLAVVGGIAVPPIAAGIPARRAAAIEPASAMRDQRDESVLPLRRGVVGVVAYVVGTAWALLADGEAKSTGVLVAMAGLLAGVPLVVAPFAGVVRSLVWRRRPGIGDIAVAQLVRRRGRTAVTAGLVAGTFSLVILVLTIAGSQRPAFADAIATTFGYDAEVSSRGPGEDRLVDAIGENPAVTAVTPVWRRQVDVVGDRPSTENLTVIEPESYFDVAGFTWSRGTQPRAAMSALRNGGAVLVSDNVADAAGVGTGDPITLQSNDGPRDFAVGGVYYGFAYGTTDAVVMAAEDARLAFGVETPTSALVDLEDPAVLAGFDPSLHVFPAAIIRNDIIEQFDGLWGLVQVIAVLVALLGLVGLANTLAMEVLDRRHEFGVLRALGLQRTEVLRLVVLEGALLTAVAVVLAVGAGTMLGWAMADAGAGGIDELEITRRFATGPALVLVAGAVLAGALVSIVPGRTAAKVSATELLRTAD